MPHLPACYQDWYDVDVFGRSILTDDVMGM
jgi:hypothetical protein